MEIRKLFAFRTMRECSAPWLEPPWPVPEDAVSSLLQKIEENTIFDLIIRKFNEHQESVILNFPNKNVSLQNFPAQDTNTEQ